MSNCTASHCREEGQGRGREPPPAAAIPKPRRSAPGEERLGSLTCLIHRLNEEVVEEIPLLVCDSLWREAQALH